MVEGVKVEDLFEDNGADANKAKEVDDIPLCAKCVVEVVGDGKAGDHEEHLIPMALDRVEQFDGGLSKRRWEASHAGAATCGVTSQPPQQYVGRAPSPIYVSMHDPLEGPAFRRSPAKPIPSWMQYLPNQRQDKPIEMEPRPASILDDHFSPSDSSIADSDAEDLLSPPVFPHKVPVRPTPPTYAPVQMSRPFTLIAEEPVQRPSSRLRPSRLPPSKHVHFHNGDSWPTDDGVLGSAAKMKSASESSEFLERYHQGHPPTVDSSSGTLGRSPSPWSRPRPAGTCSSSYKTRSSAAAETDPKHSSAFASTGTGTGTGNGQKEGRASHHEYSCHTYTPGGALFTGGGDGVSDDFVGGCGGAAAGIGKHAWPSSGRPVTVTFQDQLKRMFGFT